MRALSGAPGGASETPLGGRGKGDRKVKDTDSEGRSTWTRSSEKGRRKTGDSLSSSACSPAATRSFHPRRFSDGSELDLYMPGQYRHKDLYCVVPIVNKKVRGRGLERTVGV